MCFCGELMNVAVMVDAVYCARCYAIYRAPQMGAMKCNYNRKIIIVEK